MLDSVILEDGRRKCPHCDIIQPSNKIGFIRHVAMEHEDVMENLAKEFIEKVVKEREEHDTHAEEDVKDDRTEEETQSEISKKQTDSQTFDPDSVREKAIMEWDQQMIEEKQFETLWFICIYVYVAF